MPLGIKLTAENTNNYLKPMVKRCCVLSGTYGTPGQSSSQENRGFTGYYNWILPIKVGVLSTGEFYHK